MASAWAGPLVSRLPSRRSADNVHREKARQPTTPPCEPRSTSLGRSNSQGATGFSARRLRSSVAVYTTGNEHVFDDIDDALLLAARKRGSGLEELAQLSCRAAGTLFWGLASDQVISTYIEKLCQNPELLGANSRGFAFPERISTMADAEFFSHLGLGESGLFTQFVQAFTEWGTGTRGRASSSHVGRRYTRLCRMMTNALRICSNATK